MHRGVYRCSELLRFSTKTFFFWYKRFSFFLRETTIFFSLFEKDPAPCHLGPVLCMSDPAQDHVGRACKTERAFFRRPILEINKQAFRPLSYSWNWESPRREQDTRKDGSAELFASSARDDDDDEPPPRPPPPRRRSDGGVLRRRGGGSARVGAPSPLPPPAISFRPFRQEPNLADPVSTSCLPADPARGTRSPAASRSTVVARLCSTPWFEVSTNLGCCHVWDRVCVARLKIRCI